MSTLTRCTGIWMALASLSGCTTTVPVVSEPIPCQISAAVLTEQCAEPSALAEGATYADVIAAANEDRKNLRTCGTRNRMLANVITSCNEALEQYKAKVGEINEKFAVKR